MLDVDELIAFVREEQRRERAVRMPDSEALALVEEHLLGPAPADEVAGELYRGLHVTDRHRADAIVARGFMLPADCNKGKLCRWRTAECLSVQVPDVRIRHRPAFGFAVVSTDLAPCSAAVRALAQRVVAALTDALDTAAQRRVVTTSPLGTLITASAVSKSGAPTVAREVLAILEADGDVRDLRPGGRLPAAGRPSR